MKFCRVILKVRKSLVSVLMICILIACEHGYAQTLISGTINNIYDQPLQGINISIKGILVGSSTDGKGKFSLSTNSPLPLSLLISGVGFKSQHITVTASQSNFIVALEEQISVVDELVVSASRLEESLLTSSVSIEKMDILDVQQNPSENFYAGLANMKGVDLVPSSMLISMINTRGFGGPYQSRFVQRTDGVDMQSPSLSIPFGNIAGLHDIDVESVEIKSGASSALYGPNAFNGIMNVASKNPFLYQGLIVQLKEGVNNVDNNVEGINAKPFLDAAIRYGKVFGNKFAFKVNLSYFKAQDWVADDQRLLVPDANGINVVTDKLGGNGNALNTYGDESAIINPSTGDQVLVGGITIFRTGYREIELTDHEAENFRLSTTLYYRFSEKLEASYMIKYAKGNGLLSGGNRYSYSPKYVINKFELTGNDFFIYVYNLNQRMEGGSYDVNNSALLLKAQNKDDISWINDYQVEFNASGDHLLARGFADQGRLIPGSQSFEETLEKIKNNTASEGGAAFIEEGNITHIEGQYDLSKWLGNRINMTMGGSFRNFQVDSNGTIFDDGVGKEAVQYFDVGAYTQLKKAFFQDKLKLNASIRYDKSKFFKGQFTPRASMVLSLNQNHHFRFSYQTGFKNPTFQEQSIFFTVVPGTLPLILAGGRQGLVDNAHEGTDLAGNSLSIPYVEPEGIMAFEIGYRGVITSSLFVDINYYHNTNKNFIGLDLSKLLVYSPSLTGDPDPSAPDGIYAFYINLPGKFNTQGLSARMDYSLGKGFKINANYTWASLRDELPVGFLPNFNTPEHKANISFGNRKITDKLGFNLAWRWQNDFDFNYVMGGSLIKGKVNAFNVLDAQVSYQLSQVLRAKLGGSNVFNQYYRQALGAVNMGGMYYFTLTFNQRGL